MKTIVYDYKFYGLVLAIILIFFTSTRMVLKLLEGNNNSHTINNINHRQWDNHEIELALKNGLINTDTRKPGWNEKQREKAKKVGLMNDREWTPDEYEVARKNGLLDTERNTDWTPPQIQKAKQLNLI